jgi:hypothetical protein
MQARTPRDLFGNPNNWQNQISDGMDWMPDMEAATILDFFIAGNQVAVYTRSVEGVEALATFFVDDPGLRERLANALLPGSLLQEALERPI